MTSKGVLAKDSITRVEAMADERQTKWDLSPNDQRALRDVLGVVASLREVYVDADPAVRRSIERACASRGVASVVLPDDGALGLASTSPEKP